MKQVTEYSALSRNCMKLTRGVLGYLLFCLLVYWGFHCLLSPPVLTACFYIACSELLIRSLRIRLLDRFLSHLHAPGLMDKRFTSMKLMRQFQTISTSSAVEVLSF